MCARARAHLVTNVEIRGVPLLPGNRSIPRYKSFLLLIFQIISHGLPISCFIASRLPAHRRSTISFYSRTNLSVLLRDSLLFHSFRVSQALLRAFDTPPLPVSPSDCNVTIVDEFTTSFKLNTYVISQSRNWSGSTTVSTRFSFSFLLAETILFDNNTYARHIPCHTLLFYITSLISLELART